MKKIMISTSLIILSVLFSNSILVAAQTIDEKINEKDKQIETIVKDQESAEAYLAELDTQISQLENEYQNVLTKKNTAEKKLNEINQKISILKEKISRRNKLIDEQARDAQINKSSDSIISIMVNSETVTEAVNAMIGMTRLMSASNEIMQAQIDDKQTLETLKKEAEEKVIQAEKETISLEEKEKNLAEAKLNQNIKINEISAALATEKAEKEKFENQKLEAEKKREDELKALEEEKKKEAEAEAIFKAQEAKKQETIETQKNEQKQEEFQIPKDNTVPDSTSKNQNNEISENDTPSIDKNQNNEISENDTPSIDKNQNTSASGWGAPVSNIIITSPFGNRADPTGFSGNFHDGIDMGGTSSTPIFASRAGTVVQSSFEGSAGNYIIIDHGDGYYSYYLHMSSLIATVGQSVSAGQTIGIMGTTGNSTGVHLHFSIATSQNWTGFVDPAPYLGL
ncbi:M23 family metallopeptidase [Enterococcus casseliflavus]|uniref:M23 family metallopeptidase n=1 Tax=Enterococcus casseliflavus TaxID=37734 RepID=UPI00232AC543|nr:M23 family metallopeptidase [Enterococcus casseliflavus]MDB1688203.1 peptidoglycan DD-metalloendopeptidase family protein [Enterococcus casseliflavus]